MQQKWRSSTLSLRVSGLITIAAALLLVACSSSDGSPDGGSDARTIQVSMTDALRFEPAEIEVVAGETVRFELTNAGRAVHEFLIGDEEAQAAYAEEMASGEIHHDADGGVSVEPGQTETFEYTFDSGDGDLLAGCHEPGHYDAGMVAAIVVTSGA